MAKVKDWTATVPYGDWCLRAGGRRAYNHRRTQAKILRRVEVLRLLKEYGFKRGVQARIARELGVAPSTLCEDVWALMWGTAWQVRRKGAAPSGQRAPGG